MAGGTAGKKKKRSVDTSEKVTRTTTFSPSTEATQIAIEEQEKMKVPPAAPKGIVATLFSFSPMAIANPFQGGRVDSLVVARKRRTMRDEDEQRPFPVQPCLAVCITVSLVAALAVYVVAGSSEAPTSEYCQGGRKGTVYPSHITMDNLSFLTGWLYEERKEAALDDTSTQGDASEEDSLEFKPAEDAVAKMSNAINETASKETEDDDKDFANNATGARR